MMKKERPDQQSADFDILYQAKPDLDLMDKFTQAYIPGCEFAVDEAMIGFKGRFFLKQYLPGENKSQAYANFVKGETLHPNKSDQKETSVNIAPNYEAWEVRGLIHGMKSLNVDDARCLQVIYFCQARTQKPEKHDAEYVSAVIHLPKHQGYSYPSHVSHCAGDLRTPSFGHTQTGD
jgi:hypothetical protein